MFLQGKSAIVTGAGRGIGREVALALAAQGAKIVVNDPGVGRSGERTEERPADEVVAQIAAAGGEAAANYDSVADHRSAGNMVEQAIDTFGGLDILVNVAGILREKMIWNMSEQDFDDVIAVHLKGHWNTCHHATRHMRSAGGGTIVNCASDAFKGSVGQCNYSAAKGGIISLTRSIAKECAPKGISANTICPSADTRMTLTPEVQANRKRKLEAGLITQAQYDRTTRPRGPEFVAPFVCYLCTDGARSISGQTFHVEKGRIHTYFYGEEMRVLLKGEDGMFTIDELMESVPGSLLNGVPPLVQVVRET